MSDWLYNGADVGFIVGGAGFRVDYTLFEFGNRGIKVADRKSKGSDGGFLRN